MTKRNFEENSAYVDRLMGYSRDKSWDWVKRIWLALVVPIFLGIAAGLMFSPIFVTIYDGELKQVGKAMLVFGMVIAGICIPFALTYWWRQVQGIDRADFVLSGLRVLFETTPPTVFDDTPSVPIATLMPTDDPNRFVYLRVRASARQQKAIADFLEKNPKGLSGRKLAWAFGDKERAAYDFLNDLVKEGAVDDLGDKYRLNEKGYLYFARLAASPTPPMVMPLAPTRTSAHAVSHTVQEDEL